MRWLNQIDNIQIRAKIQRANAFANVLVYLIEFSRRNLSFYVRFHLRPESSNYESIWILLVSNWDRIKLKVVK